ncbi:MAG: patatin-like phospholipase family protein [Planctomycetota bacterium]
MTVRILLLIVATLGTGCVNNRTTAPDLEACREAEAEAGRMKERMQQKLLRLAQRRPDRLEVLLLSGGGRNGAWGAGVLEGWRRHPDHPRPARFDLVTGVSTGALMATFAFLGDRELPCGEDGALLPADEALRLAYTTTTREDVLYSRFLPNALLFGDALNDAEPLERLLERYLPDAVIDLVAEEGESGRQLFVGTTNLDCGRFAIWDMVELARERRYDTYRTVVRASAAVPLVFPPVEIDGFLHADGGIRKQLFVRDVFEPFCRTLLEREDGRPRPRLVINVLVNGPIGVPSEVVRASIADVAERALVILLDEALIDDLALVSRATENVGAEFRLAYLPDEDVPPGLVTDFDPEVMRSLHALGAAWAASREWLEEPPSLGSVGR